jgi:hypothetical protein
MQQLHSENPFLNFEPAADPFRSAAAVDANDDESGYALVKSAPDVNPSECEIAGTTALEVMILWGTTVLHVTHLTPPRAFHVGDGTPDAACDFELPEHKIGTRRLPLIAMIDGVPHAIVPACANATIELAGAARAIDDSTSVAYGELAGARAVVLTRGARLTITAGDLVFKLASGDAGKPTARRAFAEDRSAGLYFGLAAATHAVVLGALAFFTPSLGLTDDTGLDEDRKYAITQYLDAAAEREKLQKDEASSDEKPTGTGEAGPAAKGSEGKAGTPLTREVNRRMAVRGPANNPRPELPRERAIKEAQQFGLIGMLTQMNGDPKAPHVPWGRDAALGADPMSAIGNLWGDEIGDAAGFGGLRHSGYEEGGGGRGEGIGMDGIGTCGKTVCPGLDGKWGSFADGTRGGHKPKAPNVRVGPTTVSGKLPKEVIQRIVRQNYGRFRMCYEQGLVRNPNLEGRVTARFVIGREGSVSNVSNGGSDLPDSGVASCVIGAFYGLSFPSPDGGIVTVSYPIMFSPGS